MGDNEIDSTADESAEEKVYEVCLCPFCGSRGDLDGYLSGGYFVQCAEEAGPCVVPSTSAVYCATPEEAVELWNRRA